MPDFDQKPAIQNMSAVYNKRPAFPTFDTKEDMLLEDQKMPVNEDIPDRDHNILKLTSYVTEEYLMAAPIFIKYFEEYHAPNFNRDSGELKVKYVFME